MRKAYIALQLVILFAIVAHIMLRPVKGDEFTDALNKARGERGLAPVVTSAWLQAIAERNNAAQLLARNCGHFVLGGAGQCAAYGQQGVRGALQAWIQSPAHAGLIFAADLSAVGYAGDGPAHTVSLWRGQEGTTVISPTASFGQPMTWPPQDKPTTKPLAGPGTERCEPFQTRCPGRRGFHPLRRLLGRLRVTLSVSIQISL